MGRFRDRLRLAGLVGVAFALVVTGAAAGAAGGNFILGQANDAGTSSTTLAANTGGSGNGLLVTQNGTGTALRGTAGAGISGFFTSNGGSGISGVVNNTNTGHFGVYAEVSSGATGSGTNAALRAKGNAMRAIVANSTGSNAIEASTATGLGVLGTSASGSGVWGAGAGFAGGVVGDGTGALAGVIGLTDTAYGVLAFGGAAGSTGVAGLNGSGFGVYGAGPFAGTIDPTTYDYSGGAFAASIGVIGQTDGLGTNGFSRGVFGISTGSGVWGVYSLGDANVTGDLFVGGTCFGCVSATLALNGSSQTIHQGDAVTLLGVTTSADGRIALVVGPAKKGDLVLGIADRSLSLSPAKATIKGTQKTFVEGKGIVEKAGPSGTVTAKDRKWIDGGTSVAAKSYLRVITAGAFAYQPASVISAAVGDSLAVGTTAGKLSKAAATTVKGATAGRYLGKLSDGRIVILVQPN